MVSLLVVVFLIQLVCHLILTIGSKPINDLVMRRTSLSNRMALLILVPSYGKYTVVSL